MKCQSTLEEQISSKIKKLKNFLEIYMCECKGNIEYYVVCRGYELNAHSKPADHALDFGLGAAFGLAAAQSFFAGTEYSLNQDCFWSISSK